MISKSPFQLERELTKRFGAWLDEAEAIREFCVGSGLSVPSIMMPIFGAVEVSLARPKLRSIQPPTTAKKANGSHDVPDSPMLPLNPAYPRLSSKFIPPTKPDYGNRPEEAGEDWMPVPLQNASTANLILYLLNKNGGTAPSTVLSAQLPQLRPASAPSTLHMTLKKLHEEGRIHGDYRSWGLDVDVRIAITASRMWCTLEQLRSTDRAAIRREVILEALKVNQIMSVALIADCLRACDWLKGLPIDANTVKADMRILARDKHAVKEGTQWKLL